MARKSDERPPLSEAQLEIMNVVWAEQPVTVAQVWKHLSARRPLARNTVQTVMKRLEDKGWLRHRRRGNAFVYTAAAERKPTLRRMVGSLVNAAFAGSAGALVMTLLESRKVSPEEIDRIEKMIEDVRERS